MIPAPPTFGGPASNCDSGDLYVPPTPARVWLGPSRNTQGPEPANPPPEWKRLQADSPSCPRFHGDSSLSHRGALKGTQVTADRGVRPAWGPPSSRTSIRRAHLEHPGPGTPALGSDNHREGQSELTEKRTGGARPLRGQRPCPPAWSPGTKGVARAAGGGGLLSTGMNMNDDPAPGQGAAVPWRPSTVSCQRSPGKTMPSLSRQQQENGLPSSLRPQPTQVHTEGP